MALSAATWPAWKGGAATLLRPPPHPQTGGWSLSEPPLGAGDLRPQASPLPRPSSVPSVVSDPSAPGEPGLLPNKVAIYELLGR